MNYRLVMLSALFALSTGAVSWAQEGRAQRPGVCGPTNLGEATSEISFKNTIGSDFSPSFTVEGDSLTPLVNIRCINEDSIARLNLNVGVTAAVGDDLGGGTILLEWSNRRLRSGVPFDEQLVHELVAAGGLTSGTNFQDVGLLVEAGYRPVYLGLDWLKLGEQLKRVSWAEVGAFVQAGYTTPFQASEIDPMQEGEEAGTSSGALFRLKVGGKGDVRLSIPSLANLRVHFLPEGWAWYDILNNQLYGQIEGTLRLETGTDVYYDIISIKHGASPTEYTPGTQFSTGLTIRF